MGEARNLINVLSSRVLLFVGMSAGTASELALAIKTGSPAILVGQREEVVRTFGRMPGEGALLPVDGVEEAMAAAQEVLTRPG
jgi:hypothetical protein